MLLICVVVASAATRRSHFMELDGPANPALWWKLNGDRRDYAGTNHHGAVTGGHWTNGVVGQAWACTGTGDSISAGDVDVLDGEDQLTIAFWFRPDASHGDWEYIASDIGAASGTGNTHGWSIQWNSSSDDLYVQTSNGAAATYSVTSGSVTNYGAWVHVAVVYDGTQGTAANRVRIYWDGWLKGKTVTGTLPISLGTNDQPLILGRSAGVFDDFRVYNRALSQAEVETLHQLNEWPSSKLMHLKGTNTVPLVWSDNDAVTDCYADNIAWALAAQGLIQLFDASTTLSITNYNAVTLAEAQSQQTDRVLEYNLMRASGWDVSMIPAPSNLSTGYMVKPVSGVIEDTASLALPVASNLVTAINTYASPHNPMHFYEGGQLTLLADAYLMDTSIVDKVVVWFVGNNAHAASGYNEWADGWGANMVLSKFRSVIYPPNSGWNADWTDTSPEVPKAEISSKLPASLLTSRMVAKTGPPVNLPGDNDVDAPPLMVLMDSAVLPRFKRMSVVGLHTDPDTHEQPNIAPDPAGNIWMATAFDQPRITTNWWAIMTNSSIWNYGLASGETNLSAHTADFDGSDSMRFTNSAPTGLADGKAFTFSCFLRLDGGDGVAQRILDMSTSGAALRFAVLRQSNNKLYVYAVNSAGTAVIDISGSTDLLAGSGWHHLYACVDTADTAKRKLYVDGSAETLSVIQWVDDGVIDFVGTNHRYTVGASGANTRASFVDGAVAHLWFNDSYLDNPGVFRSGGNKPLHIGLNGTVPTSSTPVIWLHGPAAYFYYNFGSGGSFTIAGTLTETTSP